MSVLSNSFCKTTVKIASRPPTIVSLFGPTRVRSGQNIFSLVREKLSFVTASAIIRFNIIIFIKNNLLTKYTKDLKVNHGFRLTTLSEMAGLVQMLYISLWFAAEG